MVYLLRRLSPVSGTPSTALPSQALSRVLITPHSRSLNHSATHLSTSKPPKSTTSPSNDTETTPSPFNLWVQIQNSSRATRYTIYTGVALAATAETSFWANVIYAKWFAGEDDRERADALLDRFSAAIRGYRARYLINYRSYYTDGLWGL